MVSVETVLDLLSEERRRHALYYLEEQEESVPVDELVGAVAEMEADTTAPSHTDERLQSIKVDLQHKHFPKVEEVDFIEYNADEGVIRLTGEPPEFETMVTVAEVMDDDVSTSQMPDGPQN